MTDGTRDCGTLTIRMTARFFHESDSENERTKITVKLNKRSLIKILNQYT